MAESGPTVQEHTSHLAQRVSARQIPNVFRDYHPTARRADGDACVACAPAAQIAAGFSLGTYGKYSSTFQDARREKYLLQGAARQLRRGLPVTRCLRWTVPECHTKVLYAPDHGKAFYGGLETCGSVWECPVCASKISERRRAEVMAAMTSHRAQGGAVLLLTLTNRHHHGDSLPVLLDGQRQALRRMSGGTRASRVLLDAIGCIGSIRALETTVGANGWHPHSHVLLFVRDGLDLDRLKRDFYALWLRACLLAGMKAPSFEHGVDIRDGAAADKYVTKGVLDSDGWGLDQEITKGHIKKGRKSSRTPFDLLRDYKVGDKQAGALFVEYADAFKGKRQLNWSKGMKKRFAIEEATDPEVAEREEEDAQMGCEISRRDWGIVLAFDVRAEILEAFEQGGAFEVGHCISILRGDDVPIGAAEPVPEDLADLADFMGWSPERLKEFTEFNRARLAEDAPCS